MISADVICDSVSPEDHRLTTFKLRYPRFIHSEFMTHRVISRNASSSRAVPTRKLIEEVERDMAQPVFWGKTQGGMQAREELTGGALDEARAAWFSAAYRATEHAHELHRAGAHKQIVNRILEPFTHINVVATATEWLNFFGLRLHPDAQPEMRALAEAMWAAYQASMPNELKPGDWHLPFVYEGELGDQDHLSVATRISVARCARVSYESFETGRRSTVEEDLKLYERLVGSQPLHASPAEHQATPDDFSPGNDDWWGHPDEHGNFTGWRQYRKLLPGEAIAPLPEGYDD